VAIKPVERERPGVVDLSTKKPNTLAVLVEKNREVDFYTESL
jgi:hypothetical protein